MQSFESGPDEARRGTVAPTEGLQPTPRPATAVARDDAPAATQGARLTDLFAPDVDGTPTGPGERSHAALAPVVEARPPALARLATGVSKAILMAALVWGLFFNFSEVRGSSMRPGIQDGDRILVDHVSYMFASVARGDIVVLRYPLDPSVDYVKRVVGLPGDRVEIFRGQVWINGVRLEEDYVDAENMDPWAIVDTVVEPGHYFVLGDNRLRSSDSRDFGQVSEVYLRGKVRARLWPIARAGLIH